MDNNNYDFERFSAGNASGSSENTQHSAWEPARPVTPNYGTTAQPSAGQTTPAGSGVQPGVTYHYAAPRQSAPTQQAPATANYTWNPAGPNYAPVRPRQPKKKKRHLGLKITAGALACAVISAGSVGGFAALIQNGVVKIESPASESTETAAITLYTKADTASTASVVVEETKTAQQIAAELTPSVVLVQNYQYTSSSGFFGFSNGGSTLAEAGEGSGVILSADGYIVTNQHVVDSADAVKVVTSDGITYEAEIVGEDTQTDLAVIKVEVSSDDELTPAEFGSSDDLMVADEVMVIGNPGGSVLSSSVTFGRVSALNRAVTNSSTGYVIKCIQTDAAINPGNSGGALVDMNGHVVGINSSKIAATEYEGLGFAIPSTTVQPVVSDLIEYGYVKDRASFGFTGQYVDSLSARWYGVTAGYYVTSVTSTEAQEAGLQVNDLILTVDDTQITSVSVLNNTLAAKHPGDTVTLTLSRNGRTGTVELTLAENTGKSEATSQTTNGYSYYYAF